MTRSVSLLILRLAAALLLCLGSAAALPAAAAEWRAVLVAGDNSAPVFDNAVNAVARWLVAQGTPAADIHRLSAAPLAPGSAAAPASEPQILAEIAALRARPGERCLVFITSHGEENEGIWLARDRGFLRPAELGRALSLGCAAVPTVVVVSSCYSGSFTEMQAPNRVILSAARADRPSFGCQVGRTYTVFDGCFLAALPRAADWQGVFQRSRACVRWQERRLGVLPSRPQAFFGRTVRRLSVR